MIDTELQEKTAMLHRLVQELKSAGRHDLLLQAIGVPTVEQLGIEIAKASLSRIVITHDWHILLPDYDKELELTPIHKAVYAFFLRHPEGLEFKQLSDYRDELTRLYTSVLETEMQPEKRGILRRRKKTIDPAQVRETIDRLVNPLDNAINEKCSRIKATLGTLVDKYQLPYYIIAGHAVKHVEGSTRTWFERKKVITIPRTLVTIAPSIAPN